MSTTIRVSEATRDRFARLSVATGQPMMRLVDDAADALERRLFFQRLAQRYEELREDPTAAAEIDAERAIETGAAGDRSR